MKNMTNHLTGIDSSVLKIIRKIGRTADQRHVPAYVAGGIVRDILLGRKNLDVDVVVEGDAIRLAREMAAHFKARVKAYGQFGTATLELPQGIRVDFAGARQERYPHPGALPVVREGAWRDDLFRRDFAINAMAVRINQNHFGELIDEFGGLSDLKNGLIRVLHDQSFKDDPTRILRAVRFEQRFRFSIERKTLGLLRQAVEGKVMNAVKPPRYFVELKKMLGEEEPLRCLRRLDHLKVLRVIVPLKTIDWNLLAGIQRRMMPVQGKAVCVQPQSRWLIHFMALTGNAGPRILSAILKKFPFKSGEKESIMQARDARDLIERLSTGDLPRSQVYKILRPLNPETVFYLRLRASSRTVAARIRRYLENDIFVKLEMGGDDLKRLGLSSGQRMGEILEELLSLKLDGGIQGREEELQAARKLISAVNKQGEGYGAN